MSDLQQELRAWVFENCDDCVIATYGEAKLAEQILALLREHGLVELDNKSSAT